MWKFEVQDLGKVAEAKIRMAPLVLLVGPNNTGKSYIATLVWAITNLQPLLSTEGAKSRRPVWFEQFIEGAATVDGPSSVDVTPERAGELVAYLNEEFRIGAASFLSSVFSYDGFSETIVKISTNDFTPFRVQVAKPDLEAEKQSPFMMVRILDLQSKQPVAHYRFFVRASESIRRVEDRLFAELIFQVIFGPDSQYIRSAVYIPAARTGLVLALRSLVSNLFGSEDVTAINLSRPIKDFLSRLSLGAFPGSASGEGQKIVDWLQQEVVHGEIKQTEEEIPSFSYVPTNSTISVPLHAASSMITELAPFLIILPNRSSRGLIIFEEPEAHLHISAQRSMARALARLLNAGTRILVTTHSDTFVQQINNLMHLYSHPDREKLMAELGYSEADLIDPEMTAAFEFVESRGRTKVHELSKELAGFSVKSLNDTLVSLAQETISLDESDE